MQGRSEGEERENPPQRPKVSYTIAFAGNVALIAGLVTWLFASAKVAWITGAVVAILMLPVGRTRIGQGFGEFFSDIAHYISWH